MEQQDVTNDKAIKESDTTIFRASRTLRERFTKLGERRSIPTITLINTALEEYLKRNEYDYNDVMKIVQDDPSLKLSQELIESEIMGCPPFICSDIISIIKDKQTYIFLEGFDNILERIAKIDKKNISGIYLHFSLRKHEPNKINELLMKLGNTLKDSNLVIEIGIKENSLVEDRALIFISYNKKEDKDGRTK